MTDTGEGLRIKKRKNGGAIACLSGRMAIPSLGSFKRAVLALESENKLVVDFSGLTELSEGNTNIFLSDLNDLAEHGWYILCLPRASGQPKDWYRSIDQHYYFCLTLEDAELMEANAFA